MMANRMAYGETVHQLAQTDSRIVVVDSDLTSSVGYGPFQKDFPERYFEVGIAEQNMVAVAAGLATCGLVAFAASFSVFSTMRALDQMRNMVCYNGLNVKLIGTHAGIETGQDGATHQSVEDIAIMRAVPGACVLVPSTPLMTKRLTESMAATDGPFYMRFGKEANPELYTEADQFPLGQSRTLAHGDDLAIIACGRMVEFSLDAAELLKAKGFHARVIDMYSIKPLDEETVLKAARETGRILTVEDHSVYGGLGGAVAELVAARHPCRVARQGMEDTLGRSGNWRDLFAYYHLTPEDICQKAAALMETD